MINIFRKMWSKKQIKEVVGESSLEVLDALQDQDLKVKTLEQSEANVEFEVEVTTLGGLTEDEGSFKKCKVINGVLWCY